MAAHLPPSSTSEPGELRRFDFWSLLGISTLAFLGMYFSEFGWASTSKGFLIAFLAISTVISLLVAYGASIIPRKVGLLVLPLLEQWRSLTVSAIIYPVAIGLSVAIVALLLEREYVHLLFGWFGRTSFRTHRHHAFNTISLIANSIVEEFLFRGLLLPAVVAFVYWLWETPISRKAIPISLANLIQSFAFGALHISVGLGGLFTLPWYSRIFLIVQTWMGLALGCVYLTYGLESAVICHAVYDLLVLAQARRIIRVPTFF